MDEASRRPLTKGERTLVAKTFGALDLDSVRLCDGDGCNPFAEAAFLGTGVDAVTLVRTIFFKHGFAADFTSQDADRGLFLHEMAHIWQYQTLGLVRFALRYLRELAMHGFRQKALYVYKPGDAFAKVTLEAQAQMVQDHQTGALAALRGGR